ncbi:PDR/VanB family oxidoreductase [uncultured Sneathiella sp.]|uniref:PDR/VanB family oxidoreductase n=1 Tax=uncultured Sneathiella sp. TaxID=879315 RepID=UPI0030ED05AA|tara:strand:+ start:12214 stop:13176 length:963 start_codon:yes stop_codon:yes gene_type:complete
MDHESCIAEVATIDTETDEIKVFSLIPESASFLEYISPGSHIDVYIGDLVRQYSLCNGPLTKDFLQIAVKKEENSGGGSRSMHENVKIGQHLKIGLPRNHFPLISNASEYILIAGGIGITPLLSMARHLFAQGRKFTLVYFARSAEHAAFRQELSEPDMKEHIKLFYGLNPAETRQKIDNLLGSPQPDTHVYACGPKPFLDEIIAITDSTWPKENVHFEYFQAAPITNDKENKSFKVKLSRTGEIFEIPPEKTIAEVLKENNVPVDLSCEQGICGTCLTAVLEGTPDHRDEMLSPDIRDEGQIMTICVSRSKSDMLVLDL